MELVIDFSSVILRSGVQEYIACVVWFVFLAVTVMNSGETCRSRPSESISPRRDETGRSLHEISLRRLAPLLSELATRSGERDLA